ncbi:ubiquitin-conjugating enzyme/RWD-like protein [Obelidium mucronatum]|nr:ubiquitin-conjugating enzyme/RWD-like protein [Obelidium mucronatum]
MSNSSVLRLQREFLDISRNPDTQLSIAYDDANLTHMHALITGPAMSVYCLGMFDFLFSFPADYPTNPPKVTALTTGSINKRVRFNPNIYATGKVCLSILGTWRGEAGEQWSAAHGVSSILISIQSLLSDKPYLNEPSYENTKDEAVIENYNRKITHETIRVTICDRLEKYLSLDPDFPPATTTPRNVTTPPSADTSTSPTTGGGNNTSTEDTGDVGSSASSSTESITHLLGTFCTCREKSPFEDLCKRLFMLYHDIYLDTIDKEVAKGIKDGTRFVKARFEGAGNCMDGHFEYSALKTRLQRIRVALSNETESWITSSKLWIENETLISSNLKNQFEQITTSGEFSENIMLDLNDGNPFVWLITITNLHGTVYEDGMFACKMVFHDGFPEILPRVQFTVDVFHPNVTKDGIPFYSVKKPEEIRQHLKALLKLFFGVPDPSPATHVNLRASKMFLEGEKGKKDYNRNCRRSAQRSLEG